MDITEQIKKAQDEIKEVEAIIQKAEFTIDEESENLKLLRSKIKKLQKLADKVKEISEE